MVEEEWLKDLDEEAVKKQAERWGQILPRLDLPDPGEVIAVTFLQDAPQKVTDPKALETLGGYNITEMFVINVRDLTDGEEKSLITSKSIRQHLAALRKATNRTSLKGVSVKIGASYVKGYTTKQGQHVERAKMYWIKEIKPNEVKKKEEITEL